MLKEAAEAVGLKRLTLRSLRHTAASMWVAEGRPLTYAQTQLGYADLILVQTTYAHSSVAGLPHGDTVDRAIERERKPLRREVLLSAPAGSRARWLTTPEGEAAAQRDVEYLAGFG